MKRQRIAIAAAAVVAAVAGLLFVFRDELGMRWDEHGPRLFATGEGEPRSAREEALAAGFAFRRLEIDTSKPSAEACLFFTRELDASGKTRYGDYIAVAPETRVAVRATGERLCLAGLQFNKTYSVELKAGLPSAKGEKLEVSETIPVELRDRPPIVRFGGGILLPRENAEGVPVTTVNISRLKLKILRVGDRLLSQLESGLIDRTALYGWDAKQIESAHGSLVFEGEMDVPLSRNEPVTTLVPLRDMLKTSAPGAYLILAQNARAKTGSEDGEEYWSEIAAQWVIDSDIGLTTFQGTHGLTVFARSFSSARALSGVRLALVARNNNVLQERRTDSSGRADFDPGLFRASGGDEPVTVMAYGSGGDFTYLDLRRSGFDLTDRGVGGRPAPGPVDAFLYTERGVYRPGEKVEAVAMLRDSLGVAVTAPLTLVVTRPDGMEFRRKTVAANALMASAAHWSIQLTQGAQHGRWQLAAYLDPKADPVGRAGFDVADFVPQRLKLTLKPQQLFLKPGEDFAIRVESRFLYGAPGSGLTGESEARIARDPNPFADYAGYHWGRDNDKFEDVLVTLTVPETDDAGVTLAQGNLGQLAETSLALRATVRVSINEPGGRATDDTVTLPVLTRDAWFGIRPDFECCSVAENSRAGFALIAVDALGKRMARSGLRYQFLREDRHYDWYQENGEWKFHSTVRTRLIAGGTFEIGSNAPAKLAQSLPWGSYRLIVSDPVSGSSSSLGFWSGWAGEAQADRPDRVPVMADKASYRPGETAQVRFQPQADGRALIVVATDKVHYVKQMDASASGAVFNIAVEKEWGAGAYVLVTQYRPLRERAGRAPVRAIGVVWLGIDNSARTLSADIGGAKIVRPRQNLTIPIAVKGLSSGEVAYLTLAAVDEGILQLTDYKTPDPAGHYFGKRKLGLVMQDDYGRLIKTERAAAGSIRTGGDGFGGRPLAVVPQRTVALFSGPIKLVDGKAIVTFAVPDFNGELRLMAVMMSKEKVGSSERPLTVRDPVVGELVLPRFLAPGDVAQVGLNLHNVEGAPGSYTSVVRATGAAGLANGSAETRLTRSLNRGQRVLVPVAIQGREPGIATISLAMTGPNGFAVRRSWPIEVRPAQLPQSREDVALIEPGQSWTSNAQIASGLVPATTSVSLTVSAMHGYDDVAGLLRWLDKYPYGCVEQTTSRAMPLLVFNELAPMAGIPSDQALRARIQEAVDNVLDMQTPSGGFGMWSSQSDVNRFISVFALDFLYQAKAKGYVVPQDGLRRGARYLGETAASDSYDETTRSYAFYLLAREGTVNLSDLRYFADTRGPEMKSALAAALAAAALAQSGDRARAVANFGRAREISLAASPAKYETSDYGSLLRDVAGVTALAAEDAPQLVPALLQRSGRFNMRLNATTTQEKAWMLRAAYELSLVRAPLNVRVNGKPPTPIAGAVRLTPSYGEFARGVAVVNQGSAPVWRTVSVQGQPAQPLPQEINGMSGVSKSVWTMSGNPADLSRAKQNDRFIVLIEGRMEDNFYRQMAVLDLLPAGVEIEATLSGEEGKIYPWLGALSATAIAEARDDRYVSAFTIGSQYRPSNPRDVEPIPGFRVAYIARAVTPGRYALPAAVVEDMYNPEVRARTSMGTMNISR
ncbi:MAG: alpha-2-macroglobulin family protein [Alphaproteobacteria bacterium]